ncbi:MAG: response regulator [Dehalococcoidales bacterium]|nr:response regulator [Dehalococcoidales bacterium]
MTHSKDKTKRMLIVDDSAPIRRILGRILIDEGFNVDTASDGVIAQEMLLRNEYDIVLVDLRMPVMTGIELYQRIESKSPQAANHVVFMSADNPDPQTQRFFTKINRPFLLKPFTMDELMNTLASCRS